jgi:hypothetical protein
MKVLITMQKRKSLFESAPSCRTWHGGASAQIQEGGGDQHLLSTNYQKEKRPYTTMTTRRL